MAAGVLLHHSLGSTTQVSLKVGHSQLLQLAVQIRSVHRAAPSAHERPLIREPSSAVPRCGVMLEHMCNVKKVRVFARKLVGESGCALDASRLCPWICVVLPPRNLGVGEHTVRLKVEKRGLLVRVVVARAKVSRRKPLALHNASQLAGVGLGRRSHRAVLANMPKQEVVVAHPAHLGTRIGMRRHHALEWQVGEPGLIHGGKDCLAFHVKDRVTHEVMVDLRLPACPFGRVRLGGGSNRERAGCRHRVPMREGK